MTVVNAIRYLLPDLPCMAGLRETAVVRANQLFDETWRSQRNTINVTLTLERTATTALPNVIA